MHREIGIKYCGGCRAGYDRGLALQSIRERFPLWAFAPAQPGRSYDAIIVLCGCTAACADVSALPGEKVYLVEAEGLDALCAKLSRLLG